MANEIIRWIRAGESWLPAVANRGLRAVLRLSGLDPDAPFPGFHSAPVRPGETGVVAPEFPESDARRYGAKGDGVADDGDAIQRAIDNNRVVELVASRTFHVSRTLSVPAGKTLLVHGTLLRDPRRSNATTPLVALRGNFAKLDGTGAIATENDSPDGIVLVGMLGKDEYTDANFCYIGPLEISGRKRPGNVGINFRSSEGLVVAGRQLGGSVYLARVHAPSIYSVGTAIKFGELCNGNAVSMPMLYNLAQYGIHIEGAQRSVSENTVWGGFVHQSLTLEAFIKIERGHFNLFYGVQGEPGSGKLFDIDATSTRNQILGHGNFPDGSVSLGSGTIVLDVTKLSVPNLAVGTHLWAQSATVDLGFATTRTSGRWGREERPVVEKTLDPFVLSDVSKDRVRITGLRRASNTAQRAGGFYEITVAGAAHGPTDRSYAAKILVVPFNSGAGDKRVVAHDTIPRSADVFYSTTNGDQSVEFLFAGFKGATYGEVVCEVRYCGMDLNEPTFSTA